MRLFFLSIILFLIAVPSRADRTIPIPVDRITRTKYTVKEKADLFTDISMQDARAYVTLNSNGKYCVCIRVWFQDEYLRKRIDSLIGLVNDFNPVIKGFIVGDSVKYIGKLYFELVNQNGKLYNTINVDLDKIQVPVTAYDKFQSLNHIYKTFGGFSYYSGRMSIQLSRSFFYEVDTSTYFHDLAYNYVRIMNVYVLNYDSVLNVHFYGFPSGTSFDNAYHLLFKINKARVVVCREYVFTNIMLFNVVAILVLVIGFCIWYLNRARRKQKATYYKYMESL